MSLRPGGRHRPMHANTVEDETVIAAAKAGDEAAFGDLVGRYRRELQVHCYRMLGSFEDSEDMVQEAFLRAWRKRASFRGRSTFRAWLYRIATNACLDTLAAHPRKVARQAAGATGTVMIASEVPWLQPYPDRLLDEVAATDSEPDAAVVAKETIELAFLATIQHLPPKQRAVLIVRDVLGWSANDTASLLEDSVPAVNSALQRARATLKRHLPRRRLEWGAGPEASEEERALLERYIEAHERSDAAAVAALLSEDVRVTMPPEPEVLDGRVAVIALFEQAAFADSAPGDWRLLPTRANRQPAAANYRRQPGETEFRAVALDVLRLEGGKLAEIIVFRPEVFEAFGLPPSL
jgi:RNA polymerase sigma-70 factor (ECF subfamily)